MSLDYTDPNAAVNFRDVGLFINLIAGRTLLPERRLLRGGTIKWLQDLAAIGHPRTIFCLQGSADQQHPQICNHHFPIANDIEKYDTSRAEVRTWLRGIVRTVASGTIEFPLYVHCLSGRDRTGIVVAAFLKICGADDDHIVQEYQLSAGAESPDPIRLALAGMQDLTTYFKGVDLAQVRAVLTR
ncbi:tyrosine-protein phosphatase [Steroidobacter flavus]|uniref:Tyrosine-protein phosphatase n=1 Tax=Steroidobacter flavus TaxID=1842136 RepID=A0ABV8SYK8_9GAMM